MVNALVLSFFGIVELCGVVVNGLPSFCVWLMQMLLLNVSDNKLNALPESIGGCKSLEELQANGKTRLFLQYY